MKKRIITMLLVLMASAGVMVGCSQRPMQDANASETSIQQSEVIQEDNIQKEVIYRDQNQWEKIEARIIAFKRAVEMLKENKEATEEQFNEVFYGNELIIMTNKVAILENSLNQYKDIEKEYKKVKEDLYKIFEEKGIVSFDTGSMKITKVAPTSYDTVSIDTAKLKENEPAIYEAYKTVKTTNKKGYVLITTKKEVSNNG